MIAEKNIFTMPNYTAMQSVEKSNIYDILFYLLTEKEDNDKAS